MLTPEQFAIASSAYLLGCATVLGAMALIETIKSFLQARLDALEAAQAAQAPGFTQLVWTVKLEAGMPMIDVMLPAAAAAARGWTVVSSVATHGQVTYLALVPMGTGLSDWREAIEIMNVDTMPQEAPGA